MALSGSLVSLGTLVSIYALLALGLNIKFGYTGLLEIGHVAFYLIGAYITVLLVLPPAETREFSTYILGWGWPWAPAIFVGTIAAAVFGMLVALPAIRLREDYLAIALLGVSVIVQRFVRAESWFANGPESLRGYHVPLRNFFPLPDGSVEGAVLFGVIVAILWTAGTYSLARVSLVDEFSSTSRRVVSLLLAVSTIGVGYAGMWLAQSSSRPNEQVAIGAGLIAGIGGMVVAIVIPAVGALALLGPYSIFTWVLGGIAVTIHYRELSNQDAGIGLVLAVALVATFMPLVVASAILGDGTMGVLPTIGLLALFFYGLYRLNNRWESYGSSTPFLRVVGIGVVWLFLLRYFIQPSVSSIIQGGLGEVFEITTINLLWLINFSSSGIVLDYSRVLFLGTVTSVLVVYYVLEVTVTSPFGRVLKAIREDEDVAKALGKNTFVFKVQSMMLGSAVAGFAGGLTAMYFGTIVHAMFAPRITFITVLIVIIGGLANNRGAILGAVVYWMFQKGTSDIASFFPPEMRPSVQALRFVAIGVFLVLVLYYRPQGLWGEKTKT